jgi:hypothetical protein
MSLKSGLSALVVFAGLLSFGAPAYAAPIAASTGIPEASTLLNQVGLRCGRGWHMTRYGRCIPNRPVVRRPYRACARGFHLTPRGYCVRNW